MKAKILTILSLILVFGLSVFGQTVAKNEPNVKSEKVAGLNILPLSEVKEGMKGIARTVFRGTEPTEFNVEILGVVPGAIGPKQDMIVGRISGGGADRTAVFAGMSGSPVYINDKLVGSISYSFPFSKEPICGITPIEQMIQIFEKKTNAVQKPNSPRSFSFAELAATEWKPNFPRNAMVSSSILAGGNSTLMSSAVGQTFQPIATPLAFSGFSQETLNHFAPQLMSVGLMPVSSVGGAAKMTPLKKYDETTLLGGTSVSMQLTRGDYSMAAAGTVTFRDGEKIYAFGHPFLGLGTSDLPMSESHVVTVVPSLNNSFKMAVPDALVGTMTQDRATGVFGKLGQSPSMIPIKLNLETSRNQQESFNFEIAKDDFLTPILTNITVYNSIVANERGIGESTIMVNGEINIAGHQPIKINRRFTGAQASQLASASVAIPINNLFGSGFDNIDITGVNINVVTVDGSKTAVLERISMDKTEIKPGETFEVQAFVRANNGQVFVQKIPITIPKDTPNGTLLVAIGDGNSLQQASASKQFVPKNLDELIKMINSVKKTDRLYAQTFRITNGAIIGAKELPNLPPSVLATLNNDRTAGGFTPTVLTALTDQEIPPAEFLITGQQVLTLEVVR
jgi:SpoIVB peptidase S55